MLPQNDTICTFILLVRPGYIHNLLSYGERVLIYDTVSAPIVPKQVTNYVLTVPC